MDLSKAMNEIKKRVNTTLLESEHFKTKCEERNLDAEKIKETIKDNKILGILEQGENLYKVWFRYEKYKDLNVIIRLQGKEAKLVTVFPCYTERRKR